MESSTTIIGQPTLVFTSGRKFMERLVGLPVLSLAVPIPSRYSFEAPAGKKEVFVRTQYENHTWSKDWENLGGPIVSNVRAIAVDTNLTAVCGLSGQTGRTMLCKLRLNGQWDEEWKPVPGGLEFRSEAVLVKQKASQFLIAAVDNTNIIRFQDFGDGKWKRDVWYRVWPPYQTEIVSPVAATSWGSSWRLDYYVSFNDTTVKHIPFHAETHQWEDHWTSLGSGLQSVISATRSTWFGLHRVHIFGLNAKGTDYVSRTYDGKNWTDWVGHSGDFASAPVALNGGDDRTHIFGIGRDGKIHHQYFSKGSWNPGPTAWSDYGGGWKVFD